MFKKRKSGSILHKLEILIKVRGIYILELGTFGFRAQIIITSSGSEKTEKLTILPSVYLALTGTKMENQK